MMFGQCTRLLVSATLVEADLISGQCNRAFYSLPSAQVDLMFGQCNWAFVSLVRYWIHHRFFVLVDLMLVQYTLMLVSVTSVEVDLVVIGKYNQAFSSLLPVEVDSMLGQYKLFSLQ